jgi:phospholipid/cholesterol/gamma-HCH transport system ATP-binding protein
VSFGDNHVLRGIDLVVPRGETFALLGASGSGKTVLLRTVLGLQSIDGGTIRLFGEDIGHLKESEWKPLRRRTSVVFQGGALYGALTVAENVALVLHELHHLPAATIARRVDEALEAVGLGSIDRAMMPGELSGGMKKRLAVARAIATRPDLILYDEPTSGLDPHNSALVLGLIRRLHDERGVTSVVVTHDVMGACSIAQRIGVLVKGRLVFLGLPADLLASRDPAVLPFLRFAGVVAAEDETTPTGPRPGGDGTPERTAPPSRVR